MSNLSLVVLCVTVCLCASAWGQSPKRVSVEADRSTAPIHCRITLSLDIGAYDNPFDSSEIRVEATVTSPDGERWVAPGFLYQPYARSLEAVHEKLAPDGEAQWRVRLSLPKPGQYSVVVSVTDKTGTVSSDPLTLEATPADVPGMTRRHPSDCRYFVTDRGETLYLTGANVCWGGPGATYDYDTRLAKYADAGCNYFRVWLNPSWVTFATNTPGNGYNRIDLANAWRLDYVLELAERLGMRVLICIDSFNSLKSNKAPYGQWEHSPFNQANGGPIASPREYFTNETMRAAYRNRLRYLVARYGYSPSVFAWEFWNEVDIIDDYDSATVTAWHRDMAAHLRSIDPWNHLIGTSHAMPPGDPMLDALPGLDFVQTHHYGARDMARDLLDDRTLKAAARGRPHFHGEYGVSHLYRTPEIDPGGIHIHNGLYASVGQMQAGTPMTWWWDSYVEPKDLYPIYAAFSRWIEGFDFVAQHVRPIEARIECPAPLERIFGEGPVEPHKTSWEPAPFNEPMTVEVTCDGQLRHAVPLSRLLHGTRNHADLHNPVTFEVDAPRKTAFGVIVDGVSGHGGAALRISLDGEPVRQEHFADTDDGTRTLKQYDGTYSIRVPKGRHTIVVENTGNDWFNVAYLIPWLRDDPGLRILGVRGDTKALVWVQNRAHTWHNAARGKLASASVNGATLHLESWPPGDWVAETWDTVRGEAIGTTAVTAGGDGRLELALPDIAWDAAFRLRKAHLPRE